MKKMPTVEILLGTKNGAHWLPDQLGSIALQSGVDWSLRVSDDRSNDGTPRILNGFKARHIENKVSILEGPCLGSAANYLHLLRASDVNADFTALADQDDVWMPNRLSRAVSFLAKFPATVPCVYASRTWEIRQNGHRQSHTQKLSRRHNFDPCFRNALLQNVLAGNTIVMNRAAMDIVRSARIPGAGIPFHDWWIYLLTSGAGATIIADNVPTLFYRQHSSNLIGSPSSVLASATRIKGVIQGTYGQWLDRNLTAILQNKRLLTKNSLEQLDAFERAIRTQPPFRGWSLVTCGAFRQTRLGDFCVFGAASLGRI